MGPILHIISQVAKVYPISSQCYETSTGLYSQIRKYRAIFKIPFSHKYCQIHLSYDQQLNNSVFKSENKPEHIEFDSSCGYKSVQI